jgi:6-phosphogluconolactonase
MKHSRAPSIHRYQNLQAFAGACVDALCESLLSVLGGQANVTLAVPGGRTMGEILPPFAAASLPWERITITLVDERWVPPGHPDSNETQVRKLLGETANRVQFQGLYSAVGSPKEAAAALERRIPPPEILLLAMGDDGHIGSLFPGALENSTKSRYIVTQRADHTRITLSYAAIGAARSIILPLQGSNKERVLAAALSNSTIADLPVRYTLDRGAQVFIGPP